MAEPADPDSQLEERCRILNLFKVGYIVFGSHVARLNGLPLETIDVDVVPARLADNLTRLAEALNLLRPRWRVEGIPDGMKIDGGLEARHFLGDSAAVGLVTRLGPVDIVLEPRGFEAGYTALIAKSTTVRRGDIEIPVGALCRPDPLQGTTTPSQRHRTPRRALPPRPPTRCRPGTAAGGGPRIAPRRSGSCTDPRHRQCWAELVVTHETPLSALRAPARFDRFGVFPIDLRPATGSSGVGVRLPNAPAGWTAPAACGRRQGTESGPWCRLEARATPAAAARAAAVPVPRATGRAQLALAPVGGDAGRTGATA